MVEGATWSDHDIPYCPTTAKEPPKNLISFKKAKTLCNEAKARGISDYHIDAFVHFYLDDQNFVGKRKSIWSNPEEAISVVRHCDGLITPDFSTYADFPDPIKRDATYKMRAFGFFMASQGFEVINNVRWGTSETWEYCFDGIPEHSIIAIGTIASDIRRIDNRPLFEGGFTEMVKRIKPRTIVFYGSANNHCIKELERNGIEIIAFPSETECAYKKEGRNE